MDNLDKLWRDRHISNTTTFRIYSCSILSVLRYGYETCTLTSVGRHKLEAFHMRCHRWILGIKWSDFICNVDARAASSQESLESVVCLRRLQLFGHIAHMPYTVPAKAILTLAYKVRKASQKVTRCKRPRGRPPTTWLRQVSNDCWLTVTEALQLATDRSKWRSHVTAISAMRHCWWWWRCFLTFWTQNHTDTTDLMCVVCS